PLVVTDDHVATCTTPFPYTTPSRSTLTIHLTGTNDAPVAVADNNSGLEDATITGSVATNDSDVDDGETATLTYAQTSAVAGLIIGRKSTYRNDSSNED